MILRPYQNQAVKDIISAIKAGIKKIILRSPTGSGKTIIASRIISGARKKGNSVLFLAHRTELINQCSAKLSEMSVPHGIIQGTRNTSLGELVQVGSVATVVNRKIKTPDIIIIDEAHRARAKSYEKIVDRYPNAFVLGLTATPCRTDGRGLGEIFDKIIATIGYQELIEQNYLVPFSIYSPPMAFTMKGIKKTAGEYNKKDVSQKLAGSKIYGDVISHWQKLAKGRTTLVFCVSIEHSKAMAKKFNDIGVVAEHIDGKSKPDHRKKCIEGLRSGAIQVLCNVGVCTEGTDIPRVSCIVEANPTASLSLHHQMIGRGLRIHPESGKRNCIILDHVGNHNRLGWIDDEIEWTLETTKKAKRKSSSKPLLSVRTCPKCFLSMKSGIEVCPGCGYKFEPMRKVKEHSGSLREAMRRPKVYRTNDDGLTYFTKKILQAEEKKYKRGWAIGAYRRLFNQYPSFSQEAIEIRRMELTGVFE